MLFKKILVPLDGSLLSEAALDPALELAQTMKSEIVLLSVLSSHEPVDVEFFGYESAPVPVDVAPMRERLVNYLNSIHASRSSVGVPIRTLVLEGDAAGCVLETAVSEQVDLIVMGTHGRSGVSRFMLGSVTEKVIRQAPCPVMAIRDKFAIRNILITVNQTLLSEQALDPGFAIAGSLGAKVHLLMVTPAAPIDSEDAGEWDESSHSLRRHDEDVFRHEEAYLEDLMDRYHLEHAVETAVRGGKRDAAILSYADVHDIDLIVMATRGYSGLRRWLFGSVTEKVLRNSQCSMLVIRSGS